MDFNNSVMWNPWHGCHKKSEGCKNCYMFSQDKKYNKDSSIVTRNSKSMFELPISRDKYCGYKVKSGTTVKTCFTSDFFLEEADEWRKEALQFIKERQDLYFLILTKRPERAYKLFEENKVWPNIIIGISCENQKRFDERLKILSDIPKENLKSKLIFCSPLLEYIDISKALDEVDGIYVSGENYVGARPCKFEWVQLMSQQCSKANHTEFIFWDIGSNFWKGNKQYKITDSKLRKEQAQKANIDIMFDE